MTLSISNRAWKAVPFSYLKICSAFGVIAGIATGFPIVFSARSAEVGILAWGALNVALQLGVRLIGWRLLPDRLRSELPYSSEDAITGKGSIHSYRDLWHWIRA
jgi:hypothetical protein